MRFYSLFIFAIITGLSTTPLRGSAQECDSTETVIAQAMLDGALEKCECDYTDPEADSRYENCLKKQTNKSMKAGKGFLRKVFDYAGIKAELLTLIDDEVSGCFYDDSGGSDEDPPPDEGGGDDPPL